MKTSTVFALLGGAALGAAAALLLAPDDGKSTRKKLKRKMRDYGIDLDMLDKDEIADMIERFKHKRAKKKLDEIVD